MLNVLRVGAALAVIAAAGGIYTAYWFTPSVENEYRSSFLASHRSEFVDVTGFRIHYVELGAGPPVLMIHGGGTWSYSFRHNLGPLARSFRVIALDMPGHGYTKSRTRKAEYSYDTTDAILLEFLDAKGIERASLVGHSWGGNWALHFAQRHPERVWKLVLLASSGLPGESERLEWELLKYPVVAEILTNLFRAPAVEWGLRAAFANPAVVTQEMVQEVYTPASSPENRWAQVSYSRNLDWEEVRRYVVETHVPTLIVWGDLDAYGTFAQGEALAEAMPNARFELVAGAGHNAHEEKPVEINDLIAAFLTPL